MKFRTEIEPIRHKGLIDHNSHVLMLGSCFTTEVGSLLRRDGFDVTINPFGQLYNPASIATALQRIADLSLFTPEELFQAPADDRWHSFMCHTSLSGHSASLTASHLNHILHSAHEALFRASHLIVTLGTAWVFALADTGEIVANCHKMPSSTFHRYRLSVDEALQCLITIHRLATAVNPNMSIIFTVSPIRHIADGLHGNQLSKATLLLAVDLFLASSPGSIYFPSYEALIDDLRDYRFCAADMKHPSDVAVEYIYQLFQNSFFNDDTIATALQHKRQALRAMHRPINTHDQ